MPYISVSIEPIYFIFSERKFRKKCSSLLCINEVPSVYRGFRNWKTGFLSISPQCMNRSCWISIATFSKGFPIVWYIYYIYQLSVGFINDISTDTRTDGPTWSHRHLFLQGSRKYKLFCSPTKIVEITNGMTNLYIPFTPVVKGIKRGKYIKHVLHYVKTFVNIYINNILQAM